MLRSVVPAPRHRGAARYEWVPLYRKRRLYQRLAAIRVTVRTESATQRISPAAMRFDSTAKTGST